MGSSSLQDAYLVKDVRLLPVTYKSFPPFVEEQLENERDENERVELEIYSPPSIYTPPPYPDPLHHVNVKEDNVSLYEAELSLA